MTWQRRLRPSCTLQVGSSVDIAENALLVASMPDWWVRRRPAIGGGRRDHPGGNAMNAPMTLVSRAVLVAAGGAAVVVLRRRLWRWGTTDAEVMANLPGDSILPVVDLSATRAVTIGASAADVWPWIAQLGQGRGGFYSYDRIENLVGCGIHSVDQVVADWQQVEVGDQVNLYPGVGLAIAEVVPGRALILRGGMPIGSLKQAFDFTWAFVLRPGSGETTRLVVRERYSYTRWWTALLVEPVALISFLMSQKMLRGIRARAEAAAAGTVRCVAMSSTTESSPEQHPRHDEGV